MIKNRIKKLETRMPCKVENSQSLTDKEYSLSLGFLQEALRETFPDVAVETERVVKNDQE